MLQGIACRSDSVPAVRGNTGYVRRECVWRFSVGVVMLFLLTWCAAAPAGQQSGCFSGRDHLGHPARVFLMVERYGDWFEVWGQVHSSGTGQTYQFKADGHSGAGRMFSRHEYESGAAYIQILHLDESAFVIRVDGYGVFQFQRSHC